MEEVIGRLRRMGALFLVGLSLIIYIGFGLVYWQQISQQKNLREQVDRLNQTLSRPLPSADQLLAKYKAANDVLAPLTVEDALAVVVAIAEKHGIDVAPEAANLSIPAPVVITRARVGSGSYQLMSINNVRVEGKYDNVLAFLTDLDLGETQEVVLDSGKKRAFVGLLKRVILSRQEVIVETPPGGKPLPPEINASAVLDFVIYVKPG